MTQTCHRCKESCETELGIGFHIMKDGSILCVHCREAIRDDESKQSDGSSQKAS